MSKNRIAQNNWKQYIHISGKPNVSQLTLWCSSYKYRWHTLILFLATIIIGIPWSYFWQRLSLLYPDLILWRWLSLLYPDLILWWWLLLVYPGLILWRWLLLLYLVLFYGDDYYCYTLVLFYLILFQGIGVWKKRWIYAWPCSCLPRDAQEQHLPGHPWLENGHHPRRGNVGAGQHVEAGGSRVMRNPKHIFGWWLPVNC